jgi:uncharacterized membrane-anchored protein
MQIIWPDTANASGLRRLANKVPEITINVDVGLGLTWTSVVMAVLTLAGLFAAAIALVALCLRLIGAVLAFWTAYVLTRPLGASLGDLLSQSRDDGGLGLGTVGPSVVFLLASIGLVVYLTRSRRDVIPVS